MATAAACDSGLVARCTLVAELDGEALLDKEETLLDENEVGSAEFEDEAWLEEVTLIQPRSQHEFPCDR